MNASSGKRNRPTSLQRLYGLQTLLEAEDLPNEAGQVCSECAVPRRPSRFCPSQKKEPQMIERAELRSATPARESVILPSTARDLRFYMHPKKRKFTAAHMLLVAEHAEPLQPHVSSLPQMQRGTVHAADLPLGASGGHCIGPTAARGAAAPT